MLFRGQNMLGYRHYADDAVEYFVQKSVANGIDVIRIFDALNDTRNLQTAIKAANKEGAHVQACISYTTEPRAQQRVLRQVRQDRWRRWARTPSASRIWPVCSLPTPAMTWSRS